MKIPTFSSAGIHWKAGEGRTTLADLGVRSFPASFYIRSARTGKTRLFLNDNETNAANEFFDGEATVYFSPGEGLRITIRA